MTTLLQVRPRRFVATPAVDRIVARALRYLQSSFSVHLKGPAGTGKTTLALHLADLLGRPIMIVFGDDEFKTSDLIGNQSGYTRKKVVDNFIHSVVKVEDELKQNWVDSRLTLACREGFTLVYDEFNRSRPEVNNVLLSTLEEKLLVLPPSGNRSEYIRVHPQFRAILTSNPEEYCGVHDTQDALMDRLITIHMPEPDELTQQEILVQKTGLSREESLLVVQLVKNFRVKTGAEKSSGLRSCLMIGQVCHEHQIPVRTEDWNFRDLCSDVLLSRSSLPLTESTTLLWQVFHELSSLLSPSVEFLHPISQPLEEELEGVEVDTVTDKMVEEPDVAGELLEDIPTVVTRSLPTNPELLTSERLGGVQPVAPEVGVDEPGDVNELAIYFYLQQTQSARISELETDLGLDRVQLMDGLNILIKKGLITQRRNRVYLAV